MGGAELRRPSAARAGGPGWRGIQRLLNRSLPLVVLVAVVVVPYARHGFGFMLDDWFALANVEIDGWTTASGADQWTARPASALVYALAFGLVGARPLVHWGLLTVTLLACALALRAVVARRWGSGPAGMLTAIWVLVPTHTSLEAWAATLNINLALLSLLGGSWLLDERAGRRRRDLAGVALLTVSALAYEATAPAAFGVAAFLAWERRRRHDRSWLRVVAGGCGGVALAAAWMLVNVHPAKQGLGVTMDPTMVLTGHFGATVVGESLLAPLLSTVVLIGTAVVGWLALQRRATGWAVQAVAAGWALVVLGALPFLKYFYAPLGAGDRVTVVSGIGGALVLAGLAHLGFRRAPVPVLALSVILLVAITQQRITMVDAYTQAHRDSDRLAAHVAQRWSAPPDEPIVMGPSVVRHNTGALLEPGHILRYVFRTHDVRAELHHDRASFDAAAPGAGKIDLQELFGDQP